MSTDFDIVVVGAGAAGIAAMRELRVTDYKVLLLEASQRVGGRAWTMAYKQGFDLDLGCGWLHSADRNPWAKLASDVGIEIDQRSPAWTKPYQNLCFTAKDQQKARLALKHWGAAMRDHPPTNDSALEAAKSISEANSWLAYLEQVAGRISGKRLQDTSVADYMAYRKAQTTSDWRLRQGLGRLITTSLPEHTLVRLGTPVSKVSLEKGGVDLHTPNGVVRSRTVIMTVSTNVLASGDINLPEELIPWISAATELSLGANEKLFLEVLDESLFDPETRVIGDPSATRTGVYYLRPLGMNVVEGFFGAEAAEWIAREGPAAAFALATEELAKIFGAHVCSQLRPLVVSGWGRDRWIQGSYSCAAPGCREERRVIAQPFDQRIFFAGEATNLNDFSTVHGAFDSGKRAAGEVCAALSRDLA